MSGSSVDVAAALIEPELPQDAEDDPSWDERSLTTASVTSC